MPFVAPQHLSIRPNAQVTAASKGCPSRARVWYRVRAPYRTAIQATIPPGSNSKRNDDNKTRNQEGHQTPIFPNPNSDKVHSKSEVDMFAEQWIGTDISRWEWYERYKGRQQKIDKVNLENKRRLDEEMRLLKNTLMELEEAFGAGLLDEQSNVSPLGWSVIAFIMSTYIAFSYVVIHALVSGLLQLSSSYSLP